MAFPYIGRRQVVPSLERKEGIIVQRPCARLCGVRMKFLYRDPDMASSKGCSFKFFIPMADLAESEQQVR
jgi:hypothetical protein